MTDLEIFKKCMEWMQMEILEEKQLENGNIVITFVDTLKNTELFTKIGYEEFNSGIIVDKEGNIIKGYIDSHVAYKSENHNLINKL